MHPLDLPYNSYAKAVINQDIYGDLETAKPEWKEKREEILNREYRVFAKHINGEDVFVDYVFPDGSSLICESYLTQVDEPVIIYEDPLTEEQTHEHIAMQPNPILRMTSRYNLTDILKDIRFGRPGESQEILTKWIEELKENPEAGKPFSIETVSGVFDKAQPEE